MLEIEGRQHKLDQVEYSEAFNLIVAVIFIGRLIVDIVGNANIV